MYRFTNGVVCYDIETRDKYIKAGMTLVKEEKPEIKEEKENVKDNLQDKAECNGPRGTVRQSSKFNRRNK
jgi:hypothetical protein